MVINDFDAISVAALPNKAKPVLLIDADGVLSRAVSVQGLQREADSGQIGKLFRGGEHSQFAECLPLDASETAARLFAGDFLCLGAAKGTITKPLDLV